MANSDDLPKIPPLTQTQINRLVCADYLEHIASMIRKGIVTGISFAWDARVQKPIGNVTMSSDSLHAPLEVHMLEQVAEEQAKAEQAIQVEDISEQIKDHSCTNPGCVVCNAAKNASKD